MSESAASPRHTTRAVLTPNRKATLMDPNETLSTILRLVRQWRYNGEWDDNETHALIEHIEALDEWMNNGGFLPNGWAKNRV